MTALLAVIAGRADGAAPSPAALRAAAGAGSGASPRFASWRSADGRVALAVGREEWECRPWLAGEAEVASRGAVSVVADASLYSRAELAASLSAAGMRGVCADDSAAALIAAAYRAFGAVALLELNGDFAFVLWDADRRTLHLGRDFVGTRTLYYRVAGDRVLVASTMDGLLALSGDVPAFDLLGLAESASGLVHPTGRTCWTGVQAVPPGRVLEVRHSLDVRETARWSPPAFASDGGSDFTEAASALRDVLRTAVAERMAPDVTAVWMSGGYDSPSVFATARAAAASAGTRVESVSVSYPVGDTGREDEIIERILAHHDATGRWIDSAEMPLLGDVEREAARRDDPFVAMYDGFFRRAARETREVGGRVAFSGHGGDVLFDSPMIYLADLFGRRASAHARQGAAGVAGSDVDSGEPARGDARAARARDGRQAWARAAGAAQGAASRAGVMAARADRTADRRHRMDAARCPSQRDARERGRGVVAHLPLLHQVAGARRRRVPRARRRVPHAAPRPASARARGDAAAVGAAERRALEVAPAGRDEGNASRGCAAAAPASRRASRATIWRAARARSSRATSRQWRESRRWRTSG